MKQKQRDALEEVGLVIELQHGRKDREVGFTGCLAA